jgi:hypothetical protein
MSVDDEIEEHLSSVELLSLQLPRLRIREVMVSWVVRASSQYFSSVSAARFLATRAEVELAHTNRARGRARVLELWGEKEIRADVRRLSMAMLVACSEAADEISREMNVQISDLAAQIRWLVA